MIIPLIVGITQSDPEFQKELEEYLKQLSYNPENVEKEVNKAFDEMIEEKYGMKAHL